MVHHWVEGEGVGGGGEYGNRTVQIVIICVCVCTVFLYQEVCLLLCMVTDYPASITGCSVCCWCWNGYKYLQFDS